MSDMGARRERHRTLAGIAIVGLILLVITLVSWTSLPRWHTYTFPPEPGTGTAIAVDYPDGWQPNVRDVGGNDTKINGGIRRITFKPQEPTGLARWWDKILRQKPDQKFQPNIGLTIWHNFPSDIDSAEQSWRNAGNIFKSLNVARTKHALGPALEIKAQIDIPARPGVGMRAGNAQTRISIHNFTIYPNMPRLSKGMCLTLMFSFPADHYARTDAQFREMARRLRLVQITAHPFTAYP